MLKSDLCDYSDAYIVVKGTIDLGVAWDNDMTQKGVASKNNGPFRSCIAIVMPMYSLLEYSDNYSMTSGGLWNHYRDEVDNVNNNASDSKSFKYKTKITDKTEARPAQPGNEEDADQQHGHQYQY